MNNKADSIHEFDFDLICEYFSLLDRQGPGSPETTIKALSFVEKVPENGRIADVGCGSGGQTIVLAQHTSRLITGVDLFPVFIDQLHERVKKRGLENRVKGIVGTMEDLPFQEEELNLIWSEGAIYFMGFERGLREWRKFLKPGGYVAVSEATWFTPDRPDEINEFWQDAYPEIDTIPNKVTQMQNAGYIPVASFILPEECWTDHFYTPQIEAQQKFLMKHDGNIHADAFIANQRHEADLYAKYKDYYGYAFYIGKKTGH